MSNVINLFEHRQRIGGSQADACLAVIYDNTLPGRHHNIFMLIFLLPLAPGG